jgi:hypothetical protein
MAENLRNFAPQLFLGPVSMLRAKPGRLQFARRPAKLFRLRQTAFRRHPAINRKLFGAGLFIRPHEKRMRQKKNSSKHGERAGWFKRIGGKNYFFFP